MHLHVAWLFVSVTPCAQACYIACIYSMKHCMNINYIGNEKSSKMFVQGEWNWQKKCCELNITTVDNNKSDKMECD